MLLAIAGDYLDKCVFQKNEDEDDEDEESIAKYGMKALELLKK